MIIFPSAGLELFVLGHGAAVLAAAQQHQRQPQGSSMGGAVLRFLWACLSHCESVDVPNRQSQVIKRVEMVRNWVDDMRFAIHELDS